MTKTDIPPSLTDEMPAEAAEIGADEALAKLSGANLAPPITATAAPQDGSADLVGASGFSIDDFIVDDDGDDATAANTIVIAVGKPHKQTFFRAHPDFSVKASILTLEEGLDRTDYLLVRSIAENMAAGEYSVRQLRLLVSNFGELMLYPVAMPGDGGGGNKWAASAREALEMAETTWLRMPADRHKGCYLPRPAEDQVLMGEPRWPEDISPATIIGRAFGDDAVVTSFDHPALLKLRGKKV